MYAHFVKCDYLFVVKYCYVIDCNLGQLNILTTYYYITIYNEVICKHISNPRKARKRVV